MKVRKKKCRGAGKALGYGCNEIVLIRKYGLGVKCCYTDWLLNSFEGQKVLQKGQLIGKKKATKEQKAEDKQKKDAVTDWKAKLQSKVNEIVRLIDTGQPCLARGHHSKQLHAGHIYSRGSNPSMKFNLHNIHRQSAQSNHFQNEDGLLREGLVNEYGQEYMEFISELRQTPPLKFMAYEYMPLFRYACRIAAEMRREGKTFDKLERIEMRNKINIKLNIYKLKFCKYENNTRHWNKEDNIQTEKEKHIR